MSLRHVPHAPGDWEAPPQMPRGTGRRPLKCPAHVAPGCVSATMRRYVALRAPPMTFNSRVRIS